MTLIERSAIALVYFCSYFALEFMGALVGAVLGLDLMGSMALGLFAAMLSFVILSKKFHIALFDMRSITLKNVMWMFLIGAASWYGTEILAQLGPDVSFENQSVIEMMAEQSSVLTTAIATVIAAPIIEELLFRRILMGHAFKNHLLAGYIVTTAIFAFLHSGAALMPFVVYFSLGSGMALIYWKTKSIECAILWHMINNGIAFAQLYMFMTM